MSNMHLPRIIPCLLLKNRGLVKTVKFKDPKYIGDPINAVKIFNDKEADELAFLDITATIEKKNPQLDIITSIASECFMPMSYGGGIRTVEDVRTILSLGVEKVILNSYGYENPEFIKKVSDLFGSQSIIVSIDVRKNLFGGYEVYTNSGKKATGIDGIKWADKVEKMGAGELLVTSIDRDGTQEGYDLDLIKLISSSVKIPIIASGGAGRVEDFSRAVNECGASAVAAGSMFVFHGKRRAVLISYPDVNELRKVFNANLHFEKRYL